MRTQTRVERTKYFALGQMILCVFSFLFLSACSSPLTVKVNSGNYVNLNNQAQSVPVVVRLYQLKDDGKFTKASFRQLWRDDEATLGGQLLARKEFMITPKRKFTLRLEPIPGVKYLAAMAIFRKPTQGRWRNVVKIPTRGRHMFHDFIVNINESAITII